MPQNIDFNKRGDELLVDLVNHSHNPNNIPDSSTWPKAQVYDDHPVTPAHPDAQLIAPTSDYVVEHASYIFKKKVTLKTGNFNLKIQGDDETKVYVDGELLWSGSSWSIIYDLNFGLTPGEKTIAIEIYNGLTLTEASFAIIEDGVVIEKSDTTWPCYIIPDGEDGADYAIPDWDPIALSEVEFPNPPIDLGPVAPQFYDLSGTVTQADVGNWLMPTNHLERLWPNAVVEPNKSLDQTPVHANALVIAPRADWNLPVATPETVVLKRTMYVDGTKLGVHVRSDDNHSVYVDGVLIGSGTLNIYGGHDVTVTPGIHSIGIVCDNTGGPGGLNFAIYVDDEIVDWSDTTWKCTTSTDPLFTKQVAKISYTYDEDEEDSCSILNVSGEAVVPVTEREGVNDNQIEVNHYAELDGEDVTWDATVYKKNPQNDTSVVMRTKDPLYGVKNVTIDYTRMDINRVFALTGIALREVELDTIPGGVALNEKIFTELNRRYPVTFTSDDFSIYKSGETYTLQAKGEALAYKGFCNFTVIASLTTRVPNTALNGFVAP